MNELTPHQKEALDIEHSISLTANAGSGKTFILAKRYLDIAVNANIRVNKIAAITFTEKAAGELYKRISAELDKLILNENNPPKKGKLKSIRRDLVSAKISTIHSFCLDILREFPVEAEIDANFSPIDENKAEELLDLALEDAVKKLLGDKYLSENVKVLMRLFGSKNQLFKQLRVLIKKRKNISLLKDSLYKKEVDKIAEEYHSLFLKYAEQLFFSERKDFQKIIERLNESALEYGSSKASQASAIIGNIGTEADVIKWLKLMHQLFEIVCTTNGTIRKQGYLPAKLQQNLEEDIQYAEEFFKLTNNFIINDNFNEAELQLAKISKIIIDIFDQILGIYQSKKKEAGFLDFEDILLKTRAILFDDTVKNSLQNKYSYLLVDEFQDTNELQYEIFLPIVNYLKSGNLFVVGDEKQSIYRFRDAELEVFGRTKSDIKNKDGESSLKVLPDSFRMAPNICLFTNHLFKNLFKKPGKLYSEVEQTDIVCARDNDFKGHIEIILSDKEKEAEVIAEKILLLLNDKKSTVNNWKDIAVLVRKRKSFKEIENAFTKYKIPFLILGGTGFYQRQSVSDIFNYFAFLLDEKNDTALIGLLRSPFFSVPDSNIYRLSFYEGESYLQKIVNAAKKDNYWKKLNVVLTENLKLAKRVNPDEILRKILNESGFLSVIASRPDGEQELANVNKLISLTIDFFTEGYSTLYDYVSFLKDSIETTEDEAQGKPAASTDAVNILTIHQAKGLEYSAVFLFSCDDFTKTEGVVSKNITVSKEFGVLTKVPLNDDYFNDYEELPLVKMYNVVEKKRDLAEIKRLLYVAVTRAKDYLFISSKKNNKNIFNPYSFMYLIQKGLNIVLSSDEISIRENLGRLIKKEGKFITERETIHLHIPILKGESKKPFDDNPEKIIPDKKFLIKTIADTSANELISASRLSVFLQCPLKYKLKYVYGFKEIYDFYKRNYDKNVKSYRQEFKREEENIITEQLIFERTDIAAVKGKIIHKALQKNIPPNSIDDFVKKELLAEADSIEGSEILTGQIGNELKTDIQNFIVSEQYLFLNSFTNFKSEFEIYLKENDYYLFGIIDKIIFTEDKIIIADYKTDSITEEEINTRAKDYINQLRFYSYIVHNYFRDNRKIEMRIVFTKHPGKPVILLNSEETLHGIKKHILSFINAVRNSKFEPEISHCADCNFAINGKQCII